MMNEKIQRALAEFPETSAGDWRCIGGGVAHVDAEIDGRCKIHGGTFRGGAFRGGYFRGGDFRGGTFRGGTFRGGDFYGGTFHGGDFRGGDFCGGYFHGGTFCGGTWKRSPVYVRGTQHFVCESDNGHITSGCIRKPVTWWLKNVERCAQEHDYTESQQAEYRMIFEFVAERMRMLDNTDA